MGDDSKPTESSDERVGNTDVGEGHDASELDLGEIDAEAGDGPGSDDGGQPSDQMRDRVPESSGKIRFLLDVDRGLVAASFLLAIFLTIVLAGTFHPTPAYMLLTKSDPSETLFNALIGSTITGVTIVLTLSQLVLSQELGAVGDQRRRMEGALEFRDDVAAAIDESVSPTEPSAFLSGMVEATRQRAVMFYEATNDIDDEELGELVGAYVSNLTENAESVEDQLEDAEFGTFDVVWAALNYNYSWKIHAGRRILREYDTSLTDEAKTELDDLLQTLELFGPAREHFKTLYFQWELSNLSRVLLFAAIPALACAIGSQILLDPSDFTGTTLGVSDALLLVTATATISIAPFAILLSYILRIVTVTKRTLSIGPFILRNTGTNEDLFRNK